jgi:maltose-binding protein MalE
MNTLRKLGVLALVAAMAITGFGLAPTSTQPVAAQDTTLTIWHSWADAEADLLDEWVATFEAQSDIDVETRFIPFDELRNTYTNAVSTGEGPDMVIGQADWAGGESDAGTILPISDLIAETELEANLTEAAWDLMAVEGTRYGVPVTLDGVALYYNRDFIDDDDVPETFEEMIELGLELTEGDDLGLLFNAGFYQTAGIYFALGGQLFDPASFENLWNTDDAAVEFLQRHLQVYEADNSLVTGDNALFRNGQAAMIIDGSWNLNTYREDLGDSLGLTLLPAVDGEPWAPFFGGKGFFISNISDNVDAALEFLTFVTSPEQLATGSAVAGHIPPTDAVEVEDPYIATFSQQFALGVALPTVGMDPYWTPLGDAILAVTEGGESPEDAAANAEENILDLAGADE